MAQFILKNKRSSGESAAVSFLPAAKRKWERECVCERDRESVCVCVFSTFSHLQQSLKDAQKYEVLKHTYKS